MGFSAKHLFGEIDGTKVTFVEKNIPEERKDFLVNLLEYNGFTVLVKPEKKKKEEDPQLYTVGVTDLVFNPTIWVYDRKLRTPDGKIVSPDYWLQKSADTKPQYWLST